MRGYIDENLTPKIKINFIQKSYPAIIDTGYTEEIYIPFKIADELGIELIGSDTIMLANGEIKDIFIGIVLFRWNGKLRKVRALISDGEDILIGVKLLSDYELTINFPKLTVKFKKV